MYEFNKLVSNRETCLKLGDVEGALLISKEIMKKYNNRINGYLYFIRDLVSLNIDDQKEKILYLAVEKFPQSLEINIQLARYLFAIKCYNQSFEYAQKIIKSIQNNFLEAYLISIKCLLGTSKIDEAELLINDALKNFIENVNLLELLLEVYNQKNNLQFAEELCNRLIKQFPDKEKFHLEKIKLQVISKDYYGVFETARIARANNIKSFHILIKASEAARNIFKRDRSLVYNSEIIQLFPENSSGYRRVVDDLLWLCKFEECSKVLQIGLEKTGCEKLQKYVKSDEIKHRKKAYEDFVISGIQKQIPKFEKFSFISLGPNCLPSAILNRNYLRKSSMPFDWLICPAIETLKILKTDFGYFLDDEYLFSYDAAHSEVCGHRLYGEKLFWHHNPCNVVDKEKFSRRIKKFREILQSEDLVIFLILDSGSKNINIIREISELLGKNKYILCFNLLNYDIEVPSFSLSGNVINIAFPQNKERGANITKTIERLGYDIWHGSELFDAYQSQLADLVLKLMITDKSI